MTLITDLFAKAPFQPFTEHIVHTADCFEKIPDFFAAIAENKWEELEKIAKKIYKSEHEADKIKREILRNLPKEFIFGLPMHHLMDLIHHQDQIANAVEDLVGFLAIRHTRLPKFLMNNLDKLITSIVETCRQYQTAIKESDKLVKTSFANTATESVLATIEKVEQLEWESDKNQNKFLKNLFKHESSLKSLDAIFWLRIAKELGGIANAAEAAARAYRLIILTCKN